MLEKGIIDTYLPDYMGSFQKTAVAIAFVHPLQFL
jgi:hypothetical protein